MTTRACDTRNRAEKRGSLGVGGALTVYVLEVLLALQSSALGGGRLAIASRVDRPLAVAAPT